MVTEHPRTLNFRCTSTSQSIRMALIFSLMSGCIQQNNNEQCVSGGLLLPLP